MLKSSPKFKFNPMPTDKFVQILRTEDGHLFAEPVEFVAVVEYTDEDGERREDLCFVQLVDRVCLEPVLPFINTPANHVAFVRKEITWHERKPVYHWDWERLEYMHPQKGIMPKGKNDAV